MIDEETRKIIEWLESPAGLSWSRLQHLQNGHQTTMFIIKDDYQDELTYARMFQYWGRVYDGMYVAPHREVRTYAPVGVMVP